MQAAHPGPRVGGELVPVPLPSISLYFHVPFCSSRCNYCDFYFETTRSAAVIEATLMKILEEAEFFMESMHSPRIRSLYFGGGTPSIVPPALLDSFLERLRSILLLEAGADVNQHQTITGDKALMIAARTGRVDPHVEEDQGGGHVSLRWEVTLGR